MLVHPENKMEAQCMLGTHFMHNLEAPSKSMALQIHHRFAECHISQPLQMLLRIACSWRQLPLKQPLRI